MLGGAGLCALYIIIYFLGKGLLATLTAEGVLWQPSLLTSQLESFNEQTVRGMQSYCNNKT